MMSFVIRSKHLDAFQLAVGTSMLLHALVVFLLPGFDFSKEHETDFLTVELESYEPPTQEQVEELETVDPPTYRELERPMNKAEVPDKVVEPPQVIPDPQIVSEPEIPKLEPQATPVEIPVRRSSQQILARPKTEFIPRKSEVVAPQIAPEAHRNEVEIEPLPILQERVVELPLNRPKVERQPTSAESIPPPRPNAAERLTRPVTPKNPPSVAPTSVNPVVAQRPSPEPKPEPKPEPSRESEIQKKEYVETIRGILNEGVVTDSLIARKMERCIRKPGGSEEVVLSLKITGGVLSVEDSSIVGFSGPDACKDVTQLLVKRRKAKLESISAPEGFTQININYKLVRGR